MQRVSKRLTYANLMSSLAVFLVLAGGTAFAASQLGKNSVGSKQLKKNAVTAAKIKKEAITGAKVKKGSLTGVQINSATLGTVPNATNAANATHANSADSIPPAEASHLVGAAGQPTFQGGSSNYGSSGSLTLQSVGFYKDHEGIVHLQGLAKVGESGSFPGVLFFLPPGYRPASTQALYFNAFCAKVGKPCPKDGGGNEETYGPLIVLGTNIPVPGLDGAVLSTAGTAVSLDGITFRAES